MNLDAASQAIRSRFKTQITDDPTPGSVPTQLDNLPFTPPDDALFTKLVILPGEGKQITAGGVGNRDFRNYGVAIAMIFGPLGEGEGNLHQLADKIAQRFRSVTQSGVVFQTPSIIRVGRSGKRWQINVSCPWFLTATGQ